MQPGGGLDVISIVFRVANLMIFCQKNTCKRLLEYIRRECWRAVTDISINSLKSLANFTRKCNNCSVLTFIYLK